MRIKLEDAFHTQKTKFDKDNKEWGGTKTRRKKKKALFISWSRSIEREQDMTMTSQVENKWSEWIRWGKAKTERGTKIELLDSSPDLHNRHVNIDQKLVQPESLKLCFLTFMAKKVRVHRRIGKAHQVG